MAVEVRGNSKGPLWAKLFYSNSGREHTMTVSLRPVPASFPPVDEMDPTVMGYDLVPVLAHTALSAFVDVLRLNQLAGTSWSHYEIWMETAPGVQPHFVYTGTFTGKGGNPAFGTLVNGALEGTMTFRTSKGGRFRSVLFEVPFGIDANIGPAAIALDANMNGWMTYLLGTSSPVVGRDGSKPSGVIRMVTKINDAWRKKLINP
jgi:hypothetical protein